jgi:hypothetical protein
MTLHVFACGIIIFTLRSQSTHPKDFLPSLNSQSKQFNANSIPFQHSSSSDALPFAPLGCTARPSSKRTGCQIVPRTRFKADPSVVALIVVDLLKGA